MKLLIVDDNAAMRKLICGVMSTVCAEIHESSNGTDAIASYALNRPDLVLMDIEMEGMDGITATRTILQSYPDARIIIVTTFDDPRLRSAARAAGARDYVLKQNVIELVEMVRK